MSIIKDIIKCDCRSDTKSKFYIESLETRIKELEKRYDSLFNLHIKINESQQMDIASLAHRLYESELMISRLEDFIKEIEVIDEDDEEITKNYDIIIKPENQN